MYSLLFILLSDQYIEQLSSQTFLANMGEHTTPALQKMIRIAVAEGLKRMYKEYRLMKWLKVQEMAMTVRRVLDGESGQVNALVPYGQRSLEASPRQATYQMEVPEAYQWQPAMYPIQPASGPFIQLVSPINSPVTDTTGRRHVPALQDAGESSIHVVENPAARRDLFHSGEPVGLSGPNPQDVLDCAIQDISGLSDSSDEVLDSVNVIDPHGHYYNYPEHSAPTRPPRYLESSSPHAYGVQGTYPMQPVSLIQPVHQVENQSVNFPMMPQQQQIDNELPSDLDESMDWDSDVSSYNESEESLAGVLFAAEHLLPEEQAVRLDVEMGDMGIGHVLFDRVSAVWHNTHSQFYRAD